LEIFFQSTVTAIMAPNPNIHLPTKRKSTINPKLLDDNNVSSDAVKRRKVEALKATTQSQISTSATSQSSSRPQSSQPTTQPKPSSRQASVEAVHDDNDITCHNAGIPRNPSTILESVDDDNDDMYVAQHATGAQQVGGEETEPEEQAETDDDELGKSRLRKLPTTEYIFIHCF
jgi:hypothetical protein